MLVSRREFTHASAALIAVTVLGCDGAAEPEVAPASAPGGAPAGGGNRANLATEPFLIGTRSEFANPGLYEAFKQEKGVWVISEGGKLVALSATCTHTGCTTRWNSDTRQFICPCHGSRFDAEGGNFDNAKARRPLERCAVRLVGEGPAGQIEVDPTRRFRKDKGEWDDPAASLALA